MTGQVNLFRFTAFWTGSAITFAASLALFASFFLRDDASLNSLAMVTIIGAPLACWMAWVWSGNRSVRLFAPLLFIATVAPAMFGWIVFLYLPGLVGIVIGTPDRNPGSKMT